MADRRTILKTGAALAAAQFASPYIISARSETPIRFGMVDPLAGAYSMLAASEFAGAKFAADTINRKGEVLGRSVELLVEDSANYPTVGVQKPRKLIESDNISFIVGDLNSGAAQAMAQVTSEKTHAREGRSGSPPAGRAPGRGRQTTRSPSQSARQRPS